MSNPQASPPPKNQSAGLGCLIRMYWMGVGNVLLVFTVFYIIKARPGFITAVDLVYWAVVFSLGAFRYIDIHYLSGLTSEGAPATPAHWRRYILVLVAVAFCAWLSAHGIAHYIT